MNSFSSMLSFIVVLSCTLQTEAFASFPSRVSVRRSNQLSNYANTWDEIRGDRKYSYQAVRKSRRSTRRESTDSSDSEPAVSESSYFSSPSADPSAEPATTSTPSFESTETASSFITSADEVFSGQTELIAEPSQAELLAAQLEELKEGLLTFQWSAKSPDDSVDSASSDSKEEVQKEAKIEVQKEAQIEVQKEEAVSLKTETAEEWRPAVAAKPKPIPAPVKAAAAAPATLQPVEDGYVQKAVSAVINSKPDDAEIEGLILKDIPVQTASAEPEIDEKTEILRAQQAVAKSFISLGDSFSLGEEEEVSEPTPIATPTAVTTSAKPDIFSFFSQKPIPSTAIEPQPEKVTAAPKAMKVEEEEKTVPASSGLFNFLKSEPVVLPEPIPAPIPSPSPKAAVIAPAPAVVTSSPFDGLLGFLKSDPGVNAAAAGRPSAPPSVARAFFPDSNTKTNTPQPAATSKPSSAVASPLISAEKKRPVPTSADEKVSPAFATGAKKSVAAASTETPVAAKPSAAQPSNGLFGFFSAQKASEPDPKPVSAAIPAVKPEPPAPVKAVLPTTTSEAKPSTNPFGFFSFPKTEPPPVVKEPASSSSAVVVPAKVAAVAASRPAVSPLKPNPVKGAAGQSTVSAIKPVVVAAPSKPAPASPSSMNAKFLSTASKLLKGDSGKIKSFQKATDDFRSGSSTAADLLTVIEQLFGPSSSTVESIVVPLISELPEKDKAKLLQQAFERASGPSAPAVSPSSGGFNLFGFGQSSAKKVDPQPVKPVAAATPSATAKPAPAKPAPLKPVPIKPAASIPAAESTAGRKQSFGGFFNNVSPAAKPAAAPVVKPEPVEVVKPKPQSFGFFGSSSSSSRPAPSPKPVAEPEPVASAAAPVKQNGGFFGSFGGSSSTIKPKPSPATAPASAAASKATSSAPATVPSKTASPSPSFGFFGSSPKPAPVTPSVTASPAKPAPSKPAPSKPVPASPKTSGGFFGSFGGSSPAAASSPKPAANKPAPAAAKASPLKPAVTPGVFVAPKQVPAAKKAFVEDKVKAFSTGKLDAMSTYAILSKQLGEQTVREILADIYTQIPSDKAAKLAKAADSAIRE